MENASKALLIAAAVLIVILLIAFGMQIFNSASNTGDASEAATEIQQGIKGGVSSLNTVLQDSLKTPSEN